MSSSNVCTYENKSGVNNETDTLFHKSEADPADLTSYSAEKQLGNSWVQEPILSNLRSWCIDSKVLSQELTLNFAALATAPPHALTGQTSNSATLATP